MSLKKPVRTLRGLVARLPLKMPLTPRVRGLIAAVTLVLVWLIGPHTGFRHETDDDQAALESATTLGALSSIPLTSSRAQDRGAVARVPTPSDQVLTQAEAETFCLHYHLEPHNASAPVGSETHAQHSPTQRRIYDLLLVTSTTSASMLELHLASMYPYVDYFIILEAPSIDKKETGEQSQLPLSGAPSEAPSLLDKIWQTQLSAYHGKIIRHSLSEHSHDFKDDQDHEVLTRNAIFTSVIPLLTGAQRVEPGDVLLVSDVEELVRPVTLKVLRNCHIPQRTTIRSRKYWYSFQYIRMDSSGTKSSVDEAATLPEHPDSANRATKQASAGNEWWPHPQATVYSGSDTILPDDLRKQRDQDEYVFGDGGWTCYLCDSTITETLAKLEKAGIVWTDGPRWKAAGRVVDRVMNGVDLLERSNLSRVDANPDLPPYLQANKDRFHWMLDRDGPGAHFTDFNAADLEEYRAKKVKVEAEPDFERTNADLSFNLENTQDASPPQQADWRSGSSVEMMPVISEENRQFLAGLAGKASALSEDELAILNRAAGIGPGPG